MGLVNGYHNGVAHETSGAGDQDVLDGIKNQKVSSKPPEAIVIVGLSCRFPGDATNPEKFWEMCAEGRSAWTTIPEERFNAKAFYHPQGEKQNTVRIRGLSTWYRLTVVKPDERRWRAFPTRRPSFIRRRIFQYIVRCCQCKYDTSLYQHLDCCAQVS